MQALALCLAIFLSLAFLHCHGKEKRDANDEDTKNQVKKGRKADKVGCTYGNQDIGEGLTRYYEQPCKKVSCENGQYKETNCSQVNNENIERPQQENPNAFPKCCPSKDEKKNQNHEMCSSDLQLEPTADQKFRRTKLILDQSRKQRSKQSGRNDYLSPMLFLQA
uniref:Putative secreted protein n=1 Tax=Amblyomma americanum TaxID=6943 RepID=A0A0C9SF78_AMBAM